jgi:Tfp pilus assembly protein PilF
MQVVTQSDQPDGELTLGDAASADDMLRRARGLALRGDDEAAKRTYIEVLRRDPSHCSALVEIGALACASGHRSAARTAYRRAVLLHPGVAIAQVGFANLLRVDGDLDEARRHYLAALAAEPGMAAAHQGLAVGLR